MFSIAFPEGWTIQPTPSADLEVYSKQPTGLSFHKFFPEKF